MPSLLAKNYRRSQPFRHYFGNSHFEEGALYVRYVGSQVMLGK